MYSFWTTVGMCCDYDENTKESCKIINDIKLKNINCKLWILNDKL